MNNHIYTVTGLKLSQARRSIWKMKEKPMQYYLCKFFAALNFYRSKWSYALSLGFGFMLGIIPSGNIPLLWLFLVLACTIPMNHLTMFSIQLLVHFLKNNAAAFSIELRHLDAGKPIII